MKQITFFILGIIFSTFFLYNQPTVKEISYEVPRPKVKPVMIVRDGKPVFIGNILN